MAEAISQLKQQPGKGILSDGSAKLVRSVIATDLIDEYRLLIQPKMMAAGKLLFTAEMPAARLKLVDATPLNLGVVALTYQPGHQ